MTGQRSRLLVMNGGSLVLVELFRDIVLIVRCKTSTSSCIHSVSTVIVPPRMGVYIPSQDQIPSSMLPVHYIYNLAAKEVETQKKKMAVEIQLAGLQ